MSSDSTPVNFFKSSATLAQKPSTTLPPILRSLLLQSPVHPRPNLLVLALRTPQKSLQLPSLLLERLKYEPLWMIVPKYDPRTLRYPILLNLSRVIRRRSVPHRAVKKNHPLLRRSFAPLNKTCGGGTPWSTKGSGFSSTDCFVSA